MENLFHFFTRRFNSEHAIHFTYKLQKKKTQPRTKHTSTTIYRIFCYASHAVCSLFNHSNKCAQTKRCFLFIICEQLTSRNLLLLCNFLFKFRCNFPYLYIYFDLVMFWSGRGKDVHRSKLSVVKRKVLRQSLCCAK